MCFNRKILVLLSMAWLPGLHAQLEIPAPSGLPPMEEENDEIVIEPKLIPRTPEGETSVIGDPLAPAPAEGGGADGVMETAAGFLNNLDGPLDLVGLETTYDSITGMVSAKGNVVIRYQGMELHANRADYNPETGDVMASEDVIIFKDNRVFQSDRVSWNSKTGKIYIHNLQSDFTPFIYEARDVNTTDAVGSELETQNAFLTTHDVENPNWKVKAKRITVYPGDKVVLKDATFYFGNTPVFWLPLFHQPLQEGAGYIVTPGFNSDWGPFLLNQYGIVHGDHTLAQYHLDLYGERGIALGADFYSLRHRSQGLDFGRLKLYYLNDRSPETDPSGIDRVNPPDPQRYRVNFQHRIYLPGPEESTFYFDFDINELSDPYVYRDFFPGEYQLDPFPDNHISLVKQFPVGTLSLWTRFQANEFFPTETRLPELSMEFVRTPIGKTGLFFQGETTLGIYEQALPDWQKNNIGNQLQAGKDRLRNLVNGGADPTLIAAQKQIVRDLQAAYDGAGFTRIHSYHELLYPVTIGEWLNFVPKVGGGFSHYSDVQGEGAPDSDSRAFFHVGFDLSFKLSKVYGDVKSASWGLNELRHIIQPYLTYSLLSTDTLDPGIVGIDPLIATTRPRPLDVPLHTAVEGLNSWNVARLGVRNVLETKLGQGTYDWLSLNTYIDVFFEDPELDRSVSNLYNDLKWAPVPWISLGLLSQVPVDDDGFWETNTYISWKPTADVDLRIGNLFIQDHPFFEDSNLISTSIYYQISDRWGFSMRHAYEMDDGVMQSQSYMIMRDFQSWTTGLGTMIRDRGTGENEYSVMLMLTLKDFPNVSLPIEFNAPGAGGNP